MICGWHAFIVLGRLVQIISGHITISFCKKNEPLTFESLFWTSASIQIFFFFGLDDSTSNFPSSFYWYSLNLDSYYLFECFHPHWHSKEYFHLPNWKKSFKKETHSGHAKCRKIHNVGKSNKCLPPYFLEEELCKDVCCIGGLMCLFKYFE